MAVLVTGGAGYIGGHMVLALLDAGESVVVLDDLSTGFRWAVPPQANFVQGDFGDPAVLANVFKTHDIEAIAHFAAKIVVPESISDPMGYYFNNTIKAHSLISTAVSFGISKIIFSSTAAVYGEPKSSSVTETEPLNPVSPYGRSKLMVEWMLEDAAKAHDLRYVALRYFNVAGADPQGRHGQSGRNASHLIKRAVQTVLGRYGHIDVFGTDYPTRDGTCIRDYIQITDLISAHMLALDYLRKDGKSLVCNCGYGRGVSVLEVLNEVKRVSGTDIDIRMSPRRAGDPARLISVADLIRTELGWDPKHDNLAEMITQALDWERRLHNHHVG